MPEARRKLESLTHEELFRLRDRLPSGEEQDAVANAEHRAFAREFAREKPLQALSLVAAIPAYFAAKKLGLARGRSKASVEQMRQGFAGLFEGLRQGLLGDDREVGQ